MNRTVTCHKFLNHTFHKVYFLSPAYYKAPKKMYRKLSKNFTI